MTPDSRTQVIAIRGQVVKIEYWYLYKLARTVEKSLRVVIFVCVLTFICFCLIGVQLKRDTIGLIPCGSYLRVATSLSIG